MSSRSKRTPDGSGSGRLHSRRDGGGKDGPPAGVPAVPGPTSTPPKEGAVGKEQYAGGGGDRKKLGTLGKLYTKFAVSVGIVEKTNLESKMLNNMKYLEEYRAVIDTLLDALEGIIQQNPKVREEDKIVEPEGENPWEMVAQNLHTLQHNNIPTERKPFFTWIVVLAQRLNIAEREGFMKIRRAIRNTRRFVTVDHEKMNQMVDNLYNNLISMDSTRHELKATKTAEDLEKIGKAYKKAIREFDMQAEEIQSVIEDIPELKFRHQKELIGYFTAQENYHLSMANLIRDALKDNK